MGLEISNSRIGVASGPAALPQGKPLTPSIAEGAIFIPKPYKRVEFQLQMPDPASSKSGSKSQDSPSSPMAIKPTSAPKVVMQVIANPQKDYSVISLQQEGRQINHDSTVNFTQQYDSYGRPRMGMSREPYDFAFTKFMVKTSQLKYQENVKQSNADMKSKIDAYVNSSPQPLQASNNSDMSVPHPDNATTSVSVTA